MTSRYVYNPDTGRAILRNGPTHKNLMSRHPGMKFRNAPSPHRRTTACPKYKKSKYDNVKVFCGTCKKTFPVDTPLRARAALAYARHDRHPAAVRKCVMKHARDMGWVVNGKIHIGPRV